MTRFLPLVLAAAATLATCAYLLSIGRLLRAPSGEVRLWLGDPSDPESSQHLLDWYSPSHLIHGLLFFALLWLVARRLPIAWRFLAATAIELAWEVVENSDAVIERYRTTTVSKDYLGDTVVNVLADMACMALGFWLAARLPVWASVLIVVAFEALTIWLIRDGLALNVLMLLSPIDAIREWQAGA